MVCDLGSMLFISHPQNLYGFLYLEVFMPPLKSPLNFKSKHFFSNGPIFISKLSIPKPYIIGSTTKGACDASSFGTTSATEKCDVHGKWHLFPTMDLGPSCQVFVAIDPSVCPHMPKRPKKPKWELNHIFQDI